MHLIYYYSSLSFVAQVFASDVTQKGLWGISSNHLNQPNIREWSLSVFKMGYSKYMKVIFIVLLSAAIFTVTIRTVPYDHFTHLMNNSMVKHLFHEEPCACVERCLAASDDEWFTERFREDIDPLLSLSNSELSDNTFNWWQVCSSVRILALVLKCLLFNTSA